MPRFTLCISDELIAQIDQAAEATGQTQSELLRKALLLYLAANGGVRSGLKFGFVKPENADKLVT